MLGNNGIWEGKYEDILQSKPVFCCQQYCNFYVLRFCRCQTFDWLVLYSSQSDQDRTLVTNLLPNHIMKF
jgi:hypothetical protein